MVVKVFTVTCTSCSLDPLEWKTYVGFISVPKDTTHLITDCTQGANQLAKSIKMFDAGSKTHKKKYK